MDNPTPAPPPAPTPAPATASTDHKLSDRALLTFDVLAGIVTAMFGHDIGRQIWKIISRIKGSFQSPTSYPTQSPQSGGAPNSSADATIHSQFGGFGPWDEALTGSTLGAVLRTMILRATEAVGRPNQVIEERKLKQFITLIDFIANKLNQSQRNFLREVVGKLRTAEQQAQFWQDLTLAASTPENLRNFFRTMGIITDPPEFPTEFFKALADGMERGLRAAETHAAALNARSDARIQAVLNKLRPRTTTP